MVRPMHPTFGENLIQSDLRNLIGNPLESAALLSNLIFEGTLDRFPGLRVVASHGGGYLAPVRSADAARSDASTAPLRAPSPSPDTASPAPYHPCPGGDTSTAPACGEPGRRPHRDPPRRSPPPRCRRERREPVPGSEPAPSVTSRSSSDDPRRRPTGSCLVGFTPPVQAHVSLDKQQFPLPSKRQRFRGFWRGWEKVLRKLSSVKEYHRGVF